MHIMSFVESWKVFRNGRYLVTASNRLRCILLLLSVYSPALLLPRLVLSPLPAGSGLSSSAAIVCASSLAVAAVLGVAGSLTKGVVAEFACSAERHVGVNSGGMDQATSVMGMPGVAMLVEFNPVRRGRSVLRSNAAQCSAVLMGFVGHSCVHA
eukprot:GHRQ01033041.1.p1 GENE.GHRQ01033041.1~~GHRQ01033041.1.p1  ORF type:complete len:154 (-),score=45.43 GHRQ01033041.1:700-1161(-)